MKKLIFPILLLPFITATEAQEIFDPEMNRKAISLIKEVEIVESLKKSAEYMKCRAKNKYDDKDTPGARKQKIADAEKCFKDELKNIKDPKKLQDLSRELGLQSYGLVQSNNIKEISDYLTQKMVKALTGLDPEEEKRRLTLEFGKKKLVDQRVYFQLHTTQLGKNALYEISRYCFENFRNLTAINAKSLIEHWSGGFTDDISQLTDEGTPEFKVSGEKTDKSEIYASIQQSIAGSGQQLDTVQLQEFFGHCTKSIGELCKVYEKEVGQGGTNKRGAESCLTKARLQEIRKAIAHNEKVLKELDSTASGGQSIKLDSGQLPQFYRPESASEENSIDSLTNVTSLDVLEGGKNHDKDKWSKLKQKCAQTPEAADCEAYLAIGNDQEKAEHAIKLDMTLKRELEIQRVRTLKENDKKQLKEYLEENGYFELAEKVDNISDSDLEKAIGNIFDAKREALLAGIQSKMGSRQMTKEDEKNDKDGSMKASNIQKNIEESEAERARLAQVVLFNNIITSHLDLEKPTGEKVGRNVGALKKELKELEAENIQTAFFSNLQDGISGESGNSSVKGASIVGLSLLDSILGKAEDTQKGP